ncbi:hypothetical protein PIB30_051035 [Stylosanthes scabra]|uniref:Uncharacterized protein n=1 Tax=Stylosanthes scabra TaxID=79078 RepID=A0ABU6YK88_9FABA|nr:hypothetical protein [Stylosanthes scabra]
MSSFQRKKNNPQICVSACGGSSSVVKNKRKKKFDYNNGKCLHDLDAVILESGTEMNPERLFLRSPLWKRVYLGVIILCGRMRLISIVQKFGKFKKVVKKVHGRMSI